MRTCRCDALPVLLRCTHDVEGTNQACSGGETPFQRSASYEEATAIQNEGGADETTTKETAVEVRTTRRGVQGGQATRRGRGAHPPATRRPPNPQPTPRLVLLWLELLVFSDC
jgi:hypothetical protein